MCRQMFNDWFSKNKNNSPICPACQLPAVACYKLPTRCQLAQETPENGTGGSAAPTGASSRTPPRSRARAACCPELCPLSFVFVSRATVGGEARGAGGRSAGSARPPGARRRAEDAGASPAHFTWAKGHAPGGAPFKGRPFTQARVTPDREFGVGVSGKDGRAPARCWRRRGPSAQRGRARRASYPGRGAPAPTDHQAGDSRAVAGLVVSRRAAPPPTRTAPGHLGRLLATFTGGCRAGR